jgi:hypothetical protein
VPLDHLAQRVDDDHAAHRGVLQYRASRVAETEPADDHIQRRR